jgi:hypothetical protein
MSLPRRVEPEWLDQLPTDDPRAIRARHDLRRVNAWMRNARSMASALMKHGARQQPRMIADLTRIDYRVQPTMRPRQKRARASA